MFTPQLANDILTVATLIVLEGLLSADNALVLAVLVKHLPGKQKTKALRYGIIGAFVFRAIGVILAAYLIAHWQFKAAGAAYLLYLFIRHFFFKNNHGDSTLAKSAGPGFWKTIMFVELTDVAFSVDSIVTAVAMSTKLWVVYLGGILGIITMRFVAGLFLRLLEKFPTLESAAYAMVGWIGIKLGSETIYQMTLSKQQLDEMIKHLETPHVIPKWIFWSVMAGIIIFSILWPGKKAKLGPHAQDIRDFEKQEKEILHHTKKE